MRNPFSRLRKALKHRRKMLDMPLRLEFVLTDFCNLNCKGCTHYSPLAPREFLEIETLERSAEHLGRTCGAELSEVYLMGGETLLYPKITEAMEILRRYFPHQKLHVFTNGIVLPRMEKEFWEKVRELDVILSVTRYPVKFDYDSAIELCHSHGVKVEVFEDRTVADSFFRFALDLAKKQNGRMAHLRCYNRGCLSVIGDRIYPCSISGCVDHLNKSKGTEFKHMKGDYLNVADVCSARDIRRLRDHAVPFCSYCILPPDTVKYGPSRRDVSEWVRLKDGAEC